MATMARMAPSDSLKGQARILYLRSKIDKVNVTVSPAKTRRQWVLISAMTPSGKRSSSRLPISTAGSNPSQVRPAPAPSRIEEVVVEDVDRAVGEAPQHGVEEPAAGSYHFLYR